MKASDKKELIKEAEIYYQTPPNHFRECEVMRGIVLVIKQLESELGQCREQLGERDSEVENLKYLVSGAINNYCSCGLADDHDAWLRLARKAIDDKGVK